MILAFDVTDRIASLSWSCGDGRHGREIIGQGRATEFLLPAIERVLAATGEPLTAIGVILGPGSFTGIRVGLATAMGLAVSLAIPVHGFSKFALLDLGPGRRRLLFPAGRTAVALAELKDGHLVSEPCIIDIQKLVPEAGDCSLGALPGVNAQVLDLSLTDLALERIARGEGAGNLEPLYLRPPDAVAGRSLIDKLLNREGGHAGHENRM